MPHQVRPGRPAGRSGASLQSFRLRGLGLQKAIGPGVILIQGREDWMWGPLCTAGRTQQEPPRPQEPDAQGQGQLAGHGW